MNRPRLTRSLALSILLLCGSPLLAHAQDGEELTIAFFAPSVYFEDSLARASFVSSLAAQIEAQLGQTVRGINISSAGDLDSADFAIVDGQYFSGRQSGSPLLSARTDGSTTKELALVVASSGIDSLSELRGGTLILPRVGDQLESFVGAQVLQGEIDPSDFFGDIEYTSNIESALSAVASGRADATVAYNEYAGRSGLRSLQTYSEAPLAVAVQLNSGVDEATADVVRAALRDNSGSGGIGGFGSYDGDSVSSFRRAANRDREDRQPQMTQARTVTIDAGDVELRDVQEELPIGNPVRLLTVPTLEEP